MTEEFDTSLEVSGAGNTHLSERGKETPSGGYESATLVMSKDDVALYISAPSDHPPSIQMSCYNMENKETGRTFHMNAELTLTGQQLRMLHRFLGYLLEGIGT